jgi:hypothetical protein
LAINTIRDPASRFIAKTGASMEITVWYGGLNALQAYNQILSMTIPENQPSQTSPASGQWVRRTFQAPAGAPWVPLSFIALDGLPALPPVRDLRMEANGSWSAEEFVDSAQVPLGQFLTRAAAPVWVFVSIVQQCLAGLVALHRTGLAHGAISPQSLCVNPAGHVVLAGCGAGQAWREAAAQAVMSAKPGEPPALAHGLVVDDLRDLGRTFRAVLGGDAGQRLTVTRSDIAPLVAEWIDWLADPEPGQEPVSAHQAETIFTEIRTGHPGWRPWKYGSQLPPEIGEGHSAASAETGEQRRHRLRAAGLGQGSDFDWRTLTVAALVVLALLAGGSWLIVKFVKEKQTEEPALTKIGPAPQSNIRGESLSKFLADELASAFHLSGGDTEPVPETEHVIRQLEEAVAGLPRDAAPDWEEELRRREEDAKRLAEGLPLTDRGASIFLQSSDLFPEIGQPSAGRTPGDYYLVWRTQRLVMTWQESVALQSAMLRTARYCGVRVMAWTVLPNQAAVVLRVPGPKAVSDEKLERRIAVLRGEKTAQGVIAQINAKLKAGDHPGANQVRRTWLMSMGSAAGFFSVIRTVPIVSPDVLGDLPLWQEKPFRLALLAPDKPELLSAATAVDSAAVTAKLVPAAHRWPCCSLSAALLNYGPALRAISVLMQRNPQTDQPVPAPGELQIALRDYRRHLGDLPPEPAVTTQLPDGGAPLQPAQPPVSVNPQPQAKNQ